MEKALLGDNFERDAVGHDFDDTRGGFGGENSGGTKKWGGMQGMRQGMR